MLTKEQQQMEIKSKANIFIVESILGKTIANGQMYFLVKWEGYSHHNNTWEPIDSFSDIENLCQLVEELNATSKALLDAKRCIKSEDQVFESTKESIDYSTNAPEIVINTKKEYFPGDIETSLRNDGQVIIQSTVQSKGSRFGYESEEEKYSAKQNYNASTRFDYSFCGDNDNIHDTHLKWNTSKMTASPSFNHHYSFEESITRY